MRVASVFRVVVRLFCRISLARSPHAPTGRVTVVPIAVQREARRLLKGLITLQSDPDVVKFYIKKGFRIEYNPRSTLHKGTLKTGYSANWPIPGPWLPKDLFMRALQVVGGRRRLTQS